MRANKTHTDVVAKRSLSGHLRDPEKYIPLIERRVDYTSKLQQLGSLLVNHFLVKKLNNGETQFLETLHIVSGAGSGLLKGVFRTAMLLFTDDNRASSPSRTSFSPRIERSVLGELLREVQQTAQTGVFWKSDERIRRCHGDSFPQHVAVQFRGPSS